VVRVPAGRRFGDEVIAGAGEVFVISGDLWLGAGAALGTGDYCAGQVGVAGSDGGGVALLLSASPDILGAARR
jgi:hypothetical protein